VAVALRGCGPHVAVLRVTHQLTVVALNSAHLEDQLILSSKTRAPCGSYTLVGGESLFGEMAGDSGLIVLGFQKGAPRLKEEQSGVRLKECSDLILYFKYEEQI